MFYLKLVLDAHDGKPEDGPDVGHVHTQWTKETTTIAAPLRHLCALCPASVQDGGGGYVYTVCWLIQQRADRGNIQDFPFFFRVLP